jgi:hypothetical protein
MGIKKTLDDHELWVLTGGKAGARANLAGAYLRDANLRGVNLGGAYLRCANFHGADLSDAYLGDANFHGAGGLLQWQTPQGEKRICYSVKHNDCVMHRLGCFWGTTDEAVEAIRNKYGMGSLYEQFLLMQVQALGGEFSASSLHEKILLMQAQALEGK